MAFMSFILLLSVHFYLSMCLYGVYENTNLSFRIVVEPELNLC